MKRIEENDAASICMLADCYHNGLLGFQQDQTKAKELYARAAELGSSWEHCNLANIYLVEEI